MKARVKETGEIIEVSRYSGVMDNTNKRIYNWYEIETIDAHFTDSYWEKLLHQYAGMTMQGMISNEYTHKLYLDNKNYPNGLLNDSIKIAHALVQKLKEKEERK